jgi:hypothetical protein
MQMSIAQANSFLHLYLSCNDISTILATKFPTIPQQSVLDGLLGTNAIQTSTSSLPIFLLRRLAVLSRLTVGTGGLERGHISGLWGRLGFKNREGASDGDVLEKMLVKMKAYQMVMNEEWGICYFRAILTRFKQTRESY